MAKFLSLPVLLLLAWLCPSLPTRGAETLIEQFKRNRSVEEDKALIDTLRPEELNAVDADGRTAFFYSRHLGTTLLLLAGADPHLRDKDGRTPAFRAVTVSRDPAYTIMLDLHALAHTDVNAHDKEGYTLLAWAAHEGNLPAVRLLLLLGADPAPDDVPGDHSPLFLALQRQDDKMAALLRTDGTVSGKNDGPAPDQKLAVAARAARLASVNAALAAGADVNARDAEGKTALFRAVAERRPEVVVLLLANGANPNLAATDGKTPLMQCATDANMDSERMLMDLLVAGSDVNATARDGSTALSEAVAARNNTAAQWMIWRGASLDVHAPEGTLMQIASLMPDWPSMIELLKRAGLKEEASPQTMQEDFILFSAVRAGDGPAVEAELARGVSANLANGYDQTALEWAVTYDHFDLVDLLLRHGADINHQHNYNGEHLIHQMASWTGNNGVEAAKKIRKMLQRGANPNLLMHDGCTPLMVAARSGVTGPSLDTLLEVTADLNARDKQGMTAVGLARQHGHAQIAKLLEAKGGTE